MASFKIVSKGGFTNDRHRIPCDKSVFNNKTPFYGQQSPICRLFLNTVCLCYNFTPSIKNEHLNIIL